MQKVLLFMLLWAVTLAARAQDPTRIVVLSDTHVMPTELIVNDGKAWKEFQEADRKLLAKSAELFDVMIEQLKRERPQFLLISGDLTKDGERVAHEYIVKRLNELRQLGIQSYVVPGNHDLGTSKALIFDGKLTRPAEVINAQEFASLYADYGYGPQSTRDSHSLSYVCQLTDSLLLLAIDSKSGQLEAATLSWIDQQLQSARQRGLRVMAMMHHGLIPHFYREDRYVPTALIKDYEQLRNRLVSQGVKVMLTGHVHTSDIAMDYVSTPDSCIYDVSTGSLVSYPCHYRTLTVSPDARQLDIRTDAITAIPSESDFPAYAREQLHDRMEAYANNYMREYIKKKVGSFALLFAGSIVNQCAERLADAFIIHAEGNEGARDTDYLYAELADAIEYVPTAADMLHSILEDRTPYKTERENVTDDLTLRIMW